MLLCPRDPAIASPLQNSGMSALYKKYPPFFTASINPHAALDFLSVQQCTD